ncbi:DUF2384 domain-containing protein [Arthrobacter tumbae]|uniref:antitoxin Xre/MbcA/ParS toxin-binding domain-containing protein n=1 Tax=Arthrobacter tumbae TaxID=163874 RepID=UPI001957E9B5|nr:antitoxin Xre/MbcA/ParS toxin-binding domain-containing protein [Arthrobacter tumbae]MBM7781813.1 transcriptional regulator with XRE-family HTH domain [Arthrobacter tumbae]
MTAIAGNNALAIKVHDIIDNLGLTQEEVGQIVDASARTISRWTQGVVVPQRLNKQRLLELAYVAQAVTEVIPREHANLWMFSPNRMLGHDSPADRIHAGQYRDVLDLIEALAEGVVL